MKPLPPKQLKFALAYLETGNATQSYLNVYSVKSERVAEAASSRLLSNVIVQNFIAKRKQSLIKRNELTMDMIVKELRAIGFANMIDYCEYNDEGVEFKNINDLTPSQASAIQSIENTTNTDDKGNTVRNHRFKLYDKRMALVDLGKHMGMFNEPQQNNQTLNIFNGLNIKYSGKEPNGTEIHEPGPKESD